MGARTASSAQLTVNLPPPPVLSQASYDPNMGVGMGNGMAGGAGPNTFSYESYGEQDEYGILPEEMGDVYYDLSGGAAPYASDEQYYGEGYYDEYGNEIVDGYYDDGSGYYGGYDDGSGYYGEQFYDASAQGYDAVQSYEPEPAPTSAPFYPQQPYQHVRRSPLLALPSLHSLTRRADGADDAVCGASAAAQEQLAARHRRPHTECAVDADRCACACEQRECAQRAERAHTAVTTATAADAPAPRERSTAAASLK